VDGLFFWFLPTFPNCVPKILNPFFPFVIRSLHHKSTEIAAGMYATYPGIAVFLLFFSKGISGSADKINGGTEYAHSKLPNP
jgi:hypothetical protein